MVDIADNNKKEDSFEYRLKEVSDEEIVSIIRYRNHFQKHAVSSAIKEAIKRGLINSVDDLEKDEFSPLEIPPKSLFPLGNTYAQNRAIFKSLCRIFYVFGLIPIVYGVTLMVKYSDMVGNVFLFSGIIIWYLSFRLEKTQKLYFSNAFLLINLPVFGFAIFKLIKMGKPTVLDVFASAIIVLSVLYTTLYANKLTNHLRKTDRG